jgi:uncharacterized RDD family membrane protein YckC
VNQVFDTSVGAVEVLVDEQSRMVSAYRFDETGRAVAAAIEAWDHVDLADVLHRQLGVPLPEAARIGATVRREHGYGIGSLVSRLQERASEPERRVALDLRKAGLALRFVAVLLDGIIVLLPLSIVVGLLSGGGYAVSGNGSARAGVNVEGAGAWLLLVLAIGYYVAAETLSGATLGKRMVGIRVVGEDGAHVTFGAALVRNVLRPIDFLFFYLVGAISALLSQRGQRLGDRAAHTVVVRR